MNICHYCGFTSSSLSTVISHIRWIHSSDSSKQRVPCPCEGCPVVIKSSRCMLRHLTSVHRSQLHPSSCVYTSEIPCVDSPLIDIEMTQLESVGFDSSERSSNDFTCNDNSTQLDHCNPSDIYNASLETLADSLIRLYVRSYTVHKSTKANAKEMVFSCASIIHNFSENMVDIFRSHCQIQNSNVMSAESYFNFEQFFQRNLPRILSDANVVKYLSEHFKMPCVQTFELCSSLKHSYTYIPIKETLQLVFRSKLTKWLEFDSTLLRQQYSFFSSEYFMRFIRPLCKNAVYLGLYMDDFEICNPIGKYKKKQKLVGVYFTILNLDPRVMSTSNNFFLVMAFKRSYVTTYGLKSILAAVMNELNELYEKDIFVETLGYVSVIACFMAGDNLSQHEICGLSTSFSSGYICRFCKMTSKQSRDTLHGTYVSPSLRLHTQFIRTQLQDGFVKEDAVVTHVMYSTMPFFVVPDMMHDLLANGLSHNVICLVVLEMIRTHEISLSIFNKILKLGFQFLRGVNINMEHLKKGYLPINAADLISVLTKLPVYLAAYIVYPSESPHWRLLMNHVSILKVLLMLNINDFYLEELHCCILEEHRILLENDYQKYIKCICKYHYVFSHYCGFAKFYGSLRFLWCMRFESMHQVFKRHVNLVGNYKNVSFNLCHWFTQRLCLTYSDSNFDYICEGNWVKNYSPELLASEERNVICSVIGISLPSILKQVMKSAEHVRVASYDFKINCYIVYSTDECFEPMFEIIRKILFIKDNWYLITESVSAITLDLCMCYEPVEFNGLKCLSVLDMKFIHPPIEEIIIKGRRFITLEHYCS